MVDLLGKPVPDRSPRGAIARWAARYGYSERAIKGLVALGKEKREAPPFDDPVAMEDWATRHIGKLTKRFRQGLAMAAGESAPEKPEAAASASIDLPDVHESETGIENQLAGYQREYVMLSKMRETALKAGEFSRANNYFDQCQKISAEIRQLERLLPTVLEQRGDFQRSSQVRAGTVEFLTVLKRSLLGRASKAAARLRSATSDGEMAMAWKAEINAVFAECCASGFAENPSTDP